MSESLQQTGDSPISKGVHSQAPCYDGSRTPPEIQFEIIRRHKKGVILAEICRQVGCDPRTAKAVIENWGTSDHRLRLEAHRSQLVDAIIDSWPEASKRGKVDSLMSAAYSLGVADPPKTGSTPGLAVQINLNGGPEPVSLAKVEVVERNVAEMGPSGDGSDNADSINRETDL